MLKTLKNLWFRDINEKPLYINDVAVRIRAGILILIPIFLSYTLYDAIFGSHWIVDSSTAVDTLDTDFDDHIIYKVEAIKKTYDYTVQTIVLFYALFEMLAGMSKYTARLSPTILIASFLAKTQKPVWKPLAPKRFAWTIGAIFITICLIFFNPDTFATWVNTIAHTKILPDDRQYMPYWIPLTLIWVCFGFMWLECNLGVCMGCYIYAILVKIGIIKEECKECGNIFSAEAQKAREKYYKSKGD